MGQATYHGRPLALIVEDDQDQRELLTVLLEECDMQVFQCESAEAALLVLDKIGFGLNLLITDIGLAGHMDGVKLVQTAKQRFPHLAVIATSGRERPRDLPRNTLFMPKPWRALDVLREAERSMLH
jgi:DNA-binding NtrC family response regulator